MLQIEHQPDREQQDRDTDLREQVDLVVRRDDTGVSPQQCRIVPSCWRRCFDLRQRRVGELVTPFDQVAPIANQVQL